MTFYRKIGISSTAYKIEQVRDDGLIRWVDADHAGFLKWKAEGNVPEKIEYVPPIVPPDDDPILLATAKKEKIRAIRAEFSRLIEDEYDATAIGLRNAKAIEALQTGKAVPAAFTAMMVYIAPYEAWRAAKIVAVKACTLVSQVAAVTVSYP